MRIRFVIEGRLALAARLIAETQATQGQRVARLEAAEAARKAAAFERVQNGELRVMVDNGVDVCVQDRSVLFVDVVPYWPDLTRLVCPTCGRERLMVDGVEYAVDDRGVVSSD